MYVNVDANMQNCMYMHTYKDLDVDMNMARYVGGLVYSSRRVDLNFKN